MSSLSLLPPLHDKSLTHAREPGDKAREPKFLASYLVCKIIGEIIM